MLHIEANKMYGNALNRAFSTQWQQSTKRRNQWDCWVYLPTADLHPIHALAPSSKLPLGAAPKAHKTVRRTPLLLPTLIGFLIEQNTNFIAKWVGLFTVEVELTELKLAIFRSLLLGVDKLSSKVQTTMNLTNLQALNNLSKCKLTMPKARNQGGTDTKKRSINDKPKNARTIKNPLAWGPENKSLNPWNY